MTKLKRCPFCGFRGKLFSHAMNEDTTLWWVECDNTHCLARRTVCDCKEAAVASWNSRFANNEED